MGYFLCFSVTASVVVVTLATALLKTSIAGRNALTRRRRQRQGSRSPSGTSSPDPALIPEPNFAAALRIVTFRGICQAVAIIGVGFFCGLFFPSPDDIPWNEGLANALLWFLTVRLVSALIGLTAGFLVGALFLQALLPTSFRKSCDVQLAEYTVYFLIIFAIVAFLMLFPTHRPTLPPA